MPYENGVRISLAQYRELHPPTPPNRASDGVDEETAPEAKPAKAKAPTKKSVAAAVLAATGADVTEVEDTEEESN